MYGTVYEIIYEFFTFCTGAFFFNYSELAVKMLSCFESQHFRNADIYESTVFLLQTFNIYCLKSSEFSRVCYLNNYKVCVVDVYFTDFLLQGLAENGLLDMILSRLWDRKFLEYISDTVSM